MSFGEAVMLTVWAFVFITAIVNVIACTTASQAQDYNSAESLCAAYVGQPILVAKGQTRVATCDLIRNVVTRLGQVITVTPFSALTRRVRASPTKLWAEIMVEPALRDGCSREWTIQDTAYICRMASLPTRVILNPSGTIARWEISIPVSSPILQNQFALGAADIGVDSYTDQGVRLMTDALAMRFRQIASEGEFYRVNQSSLNVTITNIYGN